MSRRKLDARQFAPEIIPFLLVTLCARVKTLGVKPERLCEGLGMDIKQLQAGTLVSNRQAWRMIRRALQLTGRDDLGFDVGMHQDIRNFGVLGQAMQVAQTVGDAVALGLRYSPAAGALLDVEATAHADGLLVSLRPRLRDPQVVMFLVEEFLASVLDLFQRELGKPLVLQTLTLAYPAPLHASRYRALLGCEPVFNAQSNAFLIGSGNLRQPLQRHDAKRFSLLCQRLEQQAKQDALNTVDAVSHLLERNEGEPLTVVQLAQALDLSQRTLRRRLEEAGVSFRQISNRVRARQAQQLLQQGHTVLQVAEQLGFADVRSFRRAFKRWQGQLPGKLRKLD